MSPNHLPKTSLPWPALIVGPLLAGVLADRMSPSSPYFTAAGIVAGVMILKIVVHQRHTSLVRRHLLPAPQRAE